MGDITNDFTLSPSACSVVRSCMREWYHRAYGSWGGWNRAGLDHRPRLTYCLKQGRAVNAQVGLLVHDAALTMVWAGTERDLGQMLVGTALGKLEQWRDVAAAGVWQTEPKNHPMCVEFFYDEWVDWRAAEEHIRACIASLAGNDNLKRIRDTPRTVSPIVRAENLDVLNVHVPELGITVPFFVMPDVAYHYWSDGEWAGYHAVDWKTGRPNDKDEAQVQFYGLWLKTRFPDDDCSTELVYLTPQTTSKILEVDEASIEDAKRQIAEVVLVASRYVVDGDLTRNEPLPEDEFPMLPEGHSRCKHCAYRRLCDRG